jgi:dihydropteroate synthase
MHNLGIPADKTRFMSENGAEMLGKIAEFARNKIDKFGADRLIFDPGIGFGKTAEQSWFIIQNISFFKDLGIPILVGHSRKSFLRHIYNLESPSNQTLDFCTNEISQKYLKDVDFLRLHKMS